ncbi:UDP-N-acetylglucosaminyltransferase [Rhizoctonia solani AG-1 IA]|uniref:UDP-N-acetylglucosaminyltransferase n=1 Tax=Thanatephorus cucumeris (strain AG1-IA) TaxID=983506 RepID=L8WTH6_THACA|nr:UDP-N-acetylglucosaminyltransferase [Rhizoctonia solani AG-1 IA]
MCLLYTKPASIISITDHYLRMYSRALAIKPDFHVANIANATKDAGRIIESIEYYKRAVLANPYFPESIVGLAGVLGSICDWQGRGGLSSDVYLDVSGNIVVLEEGQLDSRPPGILDKILEICDSQIISAYYASSGIIASDRTLEQWMEIVEACLGPFSTQRRQRWETCLGRFYKPFDRAEKRVYEAGAVVRLIEMLSRVLQRRWYMDSYGSGAYLKGKTRELDRSKYRRPRLPAAMVAPLSLSILPFHTFTLPLSTRRIRIISHRHAIRTSYLALSQDWLPSHIYPPPPPPNNGRFKVAYISSDFNNHPLGHLMQSVFQFHNKELFEVYCYATAASDGSNYRTRIETSAHHFRDVTTWSTQAIVEDIQNEGIHILINLNGYTKGARNDIFVVRPAPIIISLMGFAGTMASGWSDYILADLQSCPPLGSASEIWRRRRREEHETSRMQDHFETLSLEHDFDIDPDPESTSEDWMFDWIIYANFNQVVFNSWLRILNRAPKSILWLLRFPSLAEGNLLRCAELWAGPDVAKRIRFTDVAPKEVHVRRCRVRTVGSVAHATGYGHRMIVSSLKDYEDRAVDLAKSVNFVAASDDQGGWYRQCRGALSDLRRSLYLSRDTMPLFDTARWTRNVERAYAEVWRRWETGTEFEESDEWLASSGEEKETSCVYVREE